MGSILVVAAVAAELCDVTNAQSVCCGVGPVEASLATARAIDRLSPAVVMNVGSAGSADLAAGTIVVGARSVYRDLFDPGATAPRVSELAPDETLLSVLRRALPDAVLSTIATTAHVGGAPDFPVEAMEGFAVLRAATVAGVPAIELRVISNSPAETNREDWKLEDAYTVLHRATRRALAALSVLIA